MALRYRVPLPGPFYYSGRVGPKHWLPRSSHTGSGPIGFTVKWFIIYPGVAIFGAPLAILLAPFYGLFWVVRRSLRNRQKCQAAQCSLVRRPSPQWPVLRPGVRPYGFVPAQRQVQTASYGFVSAQRERAAVEGGPFGSDRYV